MGIISLGGVNLRIVGIGCLTVALLLAIGGVAAGVLAVGGLAIGYFAIGGLAIGMYAIGGAALAHEFAAGGYANAKVVVQQLDRNTLNVITQNGIKEFPMSEISHELKRLLPSA